VIPAGEDFLEYLRSERALSPRTQSAYRRDLERFCEELARLDIADPGQVSEHDVRRFMARLHRQGLGPRSIQRMLSAVRSFYRWLMREGQADHNPAAPVRAPRAGRKLPGTLDADAIARLLDIQDQSPLAIRDKAMMELFYSSGLRLTELATLRWDQVDTAAGLVTVTGKGNKTRIVPLGSYAAAALAACSGRQVQFTTTCAVLLRVHFEHLLFDHSPQRYMGQHAVGGCTALPGQFRIGAYCFHGGLQVLQILVDYLQVLGGYHGVQARGVLIAIDLPALRIHLVADRVNIQFRIN